MHRLLKREGGLFMVNQVNQDLAARQFTQNVGQYGAVKAATSVETTPKTDNQSAEAVAKPQAPDTDRVELSNDAKVTNKMTDSERAALVKSE